MNKAILLFAIFGFDIVFIVLMVMARKHADNERERSYKMHKVPPPKLVDPFEEYEEQSAYDEGAPSLATEQQVMKAADEPVKVVERKEPVKIVEFVKKKDHFGPP